MGVMNKESMGLFCFSGHRVIDFQKRNLKWDSSEQQVYCLTKNEYYIRVKRYVQYNLNSGWFGAPLFQFCS